MMRTLFALLIMAPWVAHAQQAITVPCKQSLQNGQIIFDNLALPIIPEKHRWLFLRYEPDQWVHAGWREGQCVVEEVMR